jgi:hypothetical protein
LVRARHTREVGAFNSTDFSMLSCMAHLQTSNLEVAFIIAR